MPTEILFHVETGGYELPDKHHQLLSEWIKAVIAARNGKAGAINYIFCDDDYLHAMNVEYLDHDTLTDIITFPMADFPVIAGDLFISTERVADNAKDLGVTFREELHRVIIHGVLHLCGQGDKTDEQAQAMRALEDWALELRSEALLA